MKYGLKKLSSLMAVLMFSSSVFAPFTTGAETTEYISENIICDFADELPSDDELLTGYFEQKLFESDLFSISEPVTYSAFGSARLNSAELELYNTAKAHIEKVAEGTESSTVIDFNSISFTFEQLGVSEDSEQNDIQLAFHESVRKVYKYLLYDLPYELYWHDKSSGVSISMSLNNTETGIYIPSLSLSLRPGIDYKGNGEYTVDTAKTSAASTAAEKAAEIVAENAGKSDIEKLTAYKDVICEMVSYDNEAADSDPENVGIDPWQLIHAFDGDDSTNIVCEGYSKAFYYLCLLSEFSGYIDCWTVTGTMNGGGHMWNIVAIGSKNYLVDVTNCDTGTIGYPDELFLAGAKGSVSGGYTITAGNTDISYVYYSDTITYVGKKILTISDSDYSPELDDSEDYVPGNDEPDEPDDTEEGIVIWANGKKEYKSAELKTEMTATSWLNSKGKTQKGKLVWTSMLTGTPGYDLTKHKVVTKSDKTVATVSNKGKITAKSGGTALIYVTDTGALENEAFKVTVKNAPGTVYLFAEPGKTVENKKEKIKTVNVIAGGESSRVYISPYAKQGEVSDDCTYTITAKKNESGIITFTDVKQDIDGNLYFDVTGNKLLKAGKTSKISVTVTCDQSGKKASVNVQVSAPLTDAECTAKSENPVLAEKGETLALDTVLTVAGTSDTTTDKIQAVVCTSEPKADSTGKKVTITKSKQISVKLDKNTADLTLKVSKPVTEAAGVYIIATDAITKLKTVYKLADISADGKVTTE